MGGLVANKKEGSYRDTFLWGLLYLVFLILFCRLVQLHVFPDNRAIERASKQYWSYITLSSRRGMIVDCRNIPLAVSIPSTSFFIDPSEWDTKDTKNLKGMLSKKALKKLETPRKGRFLWVDRKIEANLAAKIQKLHLKGLYSVTEGKRVYPQGEDSAHILGYCDIDERGIAGIELLYDSVLYSPPENRLIAKTARGRIASILSPEVSRALREPGEIQLTVDARIQHILTEELAQVAKKEKARWASAICIDVTSGAVRGMVSWPGYNPNRRETLGNPEARRNNAIGRVYEPGSTLKPIMVGLALELGLIGWNERFRCPSKIKIADGWISEIFGHGYGDITPSEIIKKSSNVGMAQIGMRIKPQAGYDYLRFWGFGSPTGIQFPGEEKGILHKPEKWLGVVPANIAIGQGVAVTPLQLISAVTAIANGGVLYKPFIVRSIKNADNVEQYQKGRHIRNHVLTVATAERLKSAMKSVVDEGSGKRARIEGISVAGKTGTAQIARKGAYAEDNYVTSFVGFWPVEKPILSLLVVIGEPRSGNAQGGKIAAPAFRKIVEKVSALEPEYGPQNVLE